MEKKLLWIIPGIIISLLLILISIYFISITPVSKSNKAINFIIKSGTTSKQIINDLKQQDLIRSKTIMLYLVKKDNVNMQAGNYSLKPNMSLLEIMDILKTGRVNNTNVTITIPEGKNIRQMATIISNKLNTDYDTVMNAINNDTYIASKMKLYPWLTNDILNNNIYYPLEGYLFPDTYLLKDKDTEISVLLDKMLARTDEILKTINYQNKGHNIHELMTMASIVELEGINSESRAKVASVFYNRLDKGMALGSDVTTYYAAKVNLNERDLYKSEINANNPYNTRGPNMNGKLPVGPIAAPSKTAIDAAINPANTDYLYFVADKNRKIYFTKTYLEHTTLVSKLKREGLWYTWN